MGQAGSIQGGIPGGTVADRRRTTGKPRQDGDRGRELISGGSFTIFSPPRAVPLPAFPISPAFPIRILRASRERSFSRAGYCIRVGATCAVTSHVSATRAGPAALTEV